jgi:hypothetical protein
MSDTSIPLADARNLRSYARVTAAITSALAVAVLVIAVAFALVSRNPHTRTTLGLPPRADGVVVLDLSASISSDTFSRIGGTLQTLSRSGGRFGLIVFSTEAYEALPPGTPAAALAPLVRYFTLPRQSVPGYLPTFPPNPWTNTFTSGTNISTGLHLASEIAFAQRRRPTIVLISDLDDDPGDIPALTQILLSDRAKGVPLHVVGLNPTPNDVALFRAALGRQAPIVEAPTLNEVPPQAVTPFPWALVALAAAAAAALAVRIAWAPRLDWRAS